MVKYGICPLCQHALNLELPDGEKMLKLIIKAEKKAKKEMARHRVPEQPAPRSGDAFRRGRPEQAAPSSVAEMLGKKKRRKIHIDQIAALYPDGGPMRVDWLLQLSSIPAELQTLFYGVANRLPNFRRIPANLRPNTVDAFVLHSDWYIHFAREEKKRLFVRRESFNQGETRVCLLLGDNEQLVSNILHPVCPYCANLLPDEFAQMTDPPVNISLIGNPKVGKTVWQTALYNYLFHNCSSQPDYYFSIPQWVNSTSHASFTDMSDDFRRGLIPTWTLQEVVVSAFGEQAKPQPGFPQPLDFPHTQGNGAGAKAVPLVLILHQRENTMWHTRYVCIRDYPGENLKRFLNGVQNIDLVRKADAFFIFEDIFGEEENAPRDYENAAELFTGKIPTDNPPYVALIVPKADKPGFLQALHRGLSERFCEVFTKTLLHYCREDGLTPREEDCRQLARLLTEEYLRQSPENLAGCIFTNFRGLLLNSVLSGRKTAADGTPPLTAEELCELLIQDEDFRRHFEPMAASDWIRFLAQTYMFTSCGVQEVNNTHAVTFDNERNLLRQYYMRILFSAMGKYNLLLTGNYDKFRDVSIFPVSALGTEAEDRSFDARSWTPLNLPEPLFWLLYKMHG